MGPTTERDARPDPDNRVHLRTCLKPSVRDRERTRQGLLYRRRVVWREETLPPDAYEAVRRFLQTVAEADQAQAVVIERDP